MKIHQCARDARLMEIAELEAADKRVRAVQAKHQPNETKQSTEEKTEAEAPVEPTQKARSKKKKEGV